MTVVSGLPTAPQAVGTADILVIDQLVASVLGTYKIAPTKLRDFVVANADVSTGIVYSGGTSLEPATIAGNLVLSGKTLTATAPVASTGIHVVTSSGTSTLSIDLHAGSGISISSGNTINASSSATGPVAIVYGTITEVGAGQTAYIATTVPGLSLDIGGTLYNSGILEITDGTHTVSVANGSTADGTLTIGTNLTLNAAGTLTAGASGVVDITDGTHTVGAGGGTSTLTVGSNLTLNTGGTLSAGASGVTSVATGTGLTGGPVTSTGTILFASIADQRFLANTSGGSAAPIATAGGVLTAGTGLTYSSGGPYNPWTGGTLAINLVGGAGVTIANGNTIQVAGAANSTFISAVACLAGGASMGALV